MLQSEFEIRAHLERLNSEAEQIIAMRAHTDPRHPAAQRTPKRLFSAFIDLVRNPLMRTAER